MTIEQPETKEVSLEEQIKVVAEEQKQTAIAARSGEDIVVQGYYQESV
ncbi:hypothetical protein LCGC14_3134150, partial [marine sediment metagenome]